MAIRVLIADDHAVVRDGLAMILDAETDIEVVGAAEDGREAVRLAGQLGPDVVVMDIAMPELNGLDATQRIVAHRPRTQVLILSMHATAEHIYRALQAGARGYVLKESAGKEVVKGVRAVHGGRRYLSDRIGDTMVDDYLRRRGKGPDCSPLESLSSREREILQFVVEGKSSREIAEVLYLSPKTIETYRSRMMDKLAIHDLASLVRFALEHGLTPPA